MMYIVGCLSYQGPKHSRHQIPGISSVLAVFYGMLYTVIQAGWVSPFITYSIVFSPLVTGVDMPDLTRHSAVPCQIIPYTEVLVMANRYPSLQISGHGGVPVN